MQPSAGVGLDRSLIKQIELIKSGDESAFDLLREQYAALLLSMVSRAMTDHPDAEFEDLMQEATLALYHGALSFDLQQDKVTFGLYAKICVRNRLISAIRKLRRISRGSLASEKLPQTVSERKSSRRAPMGELSHLVDTLFSDLERSVYRLYLQGYSAAQIADRLGRTEKSVDNAIYRMRRKIKRHFESQ